MQEIFTVLERSVFRCCPWWTRNFCHSKVSKIYKQTNKQADRKNNNNKIRTTHSKPITNAMSSVINARQGQTVYTYTVRGFGLICRLLNISAEFGLFFCRWSRKSNLLAVASQLLNLHPYRQDTVLICALFHLWPLGTCGTVGRHRSNTNIRNATKTAHLVNLGE